MSTSSSRTSRPSARSARLAPPPANASPPAGPDAAGALRIEEAGLLYELDRPPRKDGKRVLLTVRLASGGDRPPLRDLVNLYAQRSRLQIAQLVADLFGRERREILGHLDLLLDHVERCAAAERTVHGAVVLDGPRRAAAERLLAAPDLLERAAATIAAAGFVGEERAKRLVYLVATSRLLAKPLSAILVASLSSGKSELLERVVALMPPEAVDYLSRLTPQALFYAGRDYLAHKLIVVDEEAGTQGAEYPIRTLQSRGVLRMSAPVKGRLEHFEANGPVAVLSSKTSTDVNPENLSRCLEVALDDGPEQTLRVLEAQRRAWAGEANGEVDTTLWHDAQRLLVVSDVVIPFAKKLRYPATTAKARRDQAKLLGLVAAHALLHQRTRERDLRARLIATLEDYAAVHAIVAPLIEEERDGLSARAVRLYAHMAEAGAPLTRRELAASFGWSYMSTARALSELVAQELVAASSALEKPQRYRLLDRGLLAGAVGLVAPEKLGD